MADRLIKESTLVGIADAIRSKKGSTGKINPSNFASEISSISTGITPQGTKTITENGRYSVKEFEYAEVNIPIPEGEIPNAPSMTIDIKVGEEFSLDYDRSSPEVYISKEGILTYYDDGGVIPFTAVGIGSCIVELREYKDDGDSYVVIARANVTVEAEEDPYATSVNVNIKVGEEFSLNYDRSSPDVYISNEKILTYYDDGGVIPFTAIGEGSCIVELREPKEDGRYILIARASVIVIKAEESYDFVVNVGDSFTLPVDPKADQTDYELVNYPSGIVNVHRVGGTWNATPLKAGICTIAIDDTDETIYKWTVKVVESYDFVVNVGDTFILPIDPESDQEDYELIINPSGIVDVHNDNGTWNAIALNSGTCTVAIDDGDETIYRWTVKVVGSAAEEYDGTISIS